MDPILSIRLGFNLAFAGIKEKTFLLLVRLGCNPSSTFFLDGCNKMGSILDALSERIPLDNPLVLFVDSSYRGQKDTTYLHGATTVLALKPSLLFCDRDMGKGFFRRL